ncbi:MAG: single-stranded-DNA-specific exonuclease RecJ [Gammaproteobacteria bacterium]|nr:single-stranded-DNA-specific exonuclease RecJ [Gammaproteobacteria bacterium]
MFQSVPHVTITRRAAASEFDLPDSMHPVMRRVFAGRNISSHRELDYSITNLLPFDRLKNIGAAAELLIDAIRNNKKILIVADYDADGATACAVALRGLSMLGARQAVYMVPDRVKQGYGLSIDVARQALEFDPDLLVTVDNGISSVAGVEFARSEGVDVLVTDHHLPGRELPDANVIVNPNQPGDRFPSKCIAGVGVMFYVLLAVRAGLKQAGWFAAQGVEAPNFAALLDLVALGTVADVVQLDYNNRILVYQGLRRIRARRCCQGIMALVRAAGKVPENITAADLGFQLGPRLNAAGRMADMRLGIECLLTDNFSGAVALALQLDKFNKERKLLQAEMQEQAEAYLLEITELEQGELPFGLCLFDADWHQGIVGVLAGRIKEMVNRPVIAFASAGEGLLKGSGRSIPGIHMKDTLEALAARHPDLLHRFGGHAMAAGLTIREADLAEFKAEFDGEIRSLVAGRIPGAEINTDGNLAFEDINLELAGEIENAGPWGQGFPEPLFDDVFTVADARTVGERHLKLKLLADGAQRPVEAIAFNTAPDALASSAQGHRFVYRLAVNEYNGVRTPQLVIEHIEQQGSAIQGSE